MSSAVEPHPSQSAWASPVEAFDAFLAGLGKVGTETLDPACAAGRVLAASIITDRPHPPCDVSAVDGYALRLSDVAAKSLPLAGEAFPGYAPMVLPAGKTIRINTGAAVPQGAETVVKREDVLERNGHIVLPAETRSTHVGEHIRRCGENIGKGEQVLAAGTLITPPVMAVLASFCTGHVLVYCRVRVGVLITGDELLQANASPRAWQLRDANGPLLQSMLANHPWINVVENQHVSDDAGRIRGALQNLLRKCDAVLTTGGVSMGTCDYVSSAMEDIGARIVFHGLPIRPGKPVLAAWGPDGQMILGLPGNPVPVLTMSRRFGIPALALQAGSNDPNRAVHRVIVADPPSDNLHWWWHRLAKWVAPGTVELVPNRGAGDFVAAGLSDGFIELPPHATGPGPWPFYPWTT